MKPLLWFLSILLICSGGLGSTTRASGEAGGSPSSSANWTAEPNQLDASFGSSVASAGDVNGDGYEDVIVGAGTYDNGQIDEGRAFVFYGSAVGLSQTPNWRAESNQAGAYFGNSVASAGDVNGDGYDDVIVGAWTYDNGQIGEGRAFVFYGSAVGLSETPNWIAESNQASAYFGYSVASAGDVNGDGYDDVIVGAYSYDNGQENEGRAFAFYGSAGGLGTTPNWKAELSQDAAFGYSVASAGDVNGDGYDDVIVGAPFYYDDNDDYEGEAFVFLGSIGGLSTNYSWKVEPNRVRAFFGYSVGSAGDVNGDGFYDVIVGARWYTHGQDSEGRAFVFYGSAGGLSIIPNWIAESNQANAELGHSVARAGDMNADGYDDVIVGVPYYDHGQTDEGVAFVYNGSLVGPNG